MAGLGWNVDKDEYKDNDLSRPAWVAKVIIGDNDSSEHTVFVLLVMTMLIIIMKTMKIMIFIAHLHAPHRSDAVVPPR